MGLTKKLSQKRILNIIDETIDNFGKHLQNYEENTSPIILDLAVKYFNKEKIIGNKKSFLSENEKEIFERYITKRFEINEKFPETRNRNKGLLINLIPVGQQRRRESYKTTLKQLGVYS